MSLPSIVCTPHSIASKRFAASSLCVAIGHRVERHVVGVVNEDEVIELEVAGEGDRLHGHAFLHAAVAGERDDVVVENRCASPC